jgi:uncharacterized repeat protein (TIGR03803 family)
MVLSFIVMGGVLWGGLSGAFPGPAGASEKPLASFSRGTGFWPVAGVVQGPDGAFYGTGAIGGSRPCGCGTIYRVTAGGQLSVLHSFAASEGSAPVAGLVLARDGRLYGTTAVGPGHGGGAIFGIDPTGARFRVIHYFQPNRRPDGGNTEAALTQGTDGFLYGTTIAGTNSGILFRIEPDGSKFEILHAFVAATGVDSYGSLLQGTDGRFYGTTAQGGKANKGTVFAFQTAGSRYTVLHQFDGSDGNFPQSGLVETKVGRLFGTTTGNANGRFPNGTVFGLDTNGARFRTVHVFDGSHGAGPFGNMWLGKDGVLYGTTDLGGSAGVGTVFRVGARGAGFAVLHSFAGAPSDGQYPHGAIIQSMVDGKFYGTTNAGGSNICGASNEYCGTVFELSL